MPTPRPSQRLGLGDGARESVQHESARTIGLGEALSNQGHHQIVRHQLAGVHDVLRLAPKLGALPHGSAQHVAGGDLGNTEAAGEKARLGPLCRNPDCRVG